MGKGEAYAGFWWGNLRERDHLEDMLRWEDGINMDLKEVGWDMVWIELPEDWNR